MSDVPHKFPIRVELEPGTYYWCACGKSKTQPLCDGSHKGSEFRPKAFTVSAKKLAAYCQCKKSRNAPFCDGSHARE